MATSDSIDTIFGKVGLDVLGEIFSFVDAVSLSNLLSLSASLWRLRTEPKLQIRINPYKQHYKKKNWNGGLCASVENNNLVQAFFFIKKGAWKFDLALKHAAKAGHKDMIHFLISKGAKSWRWGMLSSALSGNLELVDFFLHQSTTGWIRAQRRMPSYQELDRYSLGMREAALEGHKEIVEYFVEKGANRWNMGLRAAAMGGHTDLVDYFIKKGASDWAGAMYYAIKGGHWNLFEFFKEKSQRLLYAGTSPFLKHMVKAAYMEVTEIYFYGLLIMIMVIGS